MSLSTGTTTLPGPRAADTLLRALHTGQPITYAHRLFATTAPTLLATLLAAIDKDRAVPVADHVLRTLEPRLSPVATFTFANKPSDPVRAQSAFRALTSGEGSYAATLAPPRGNTDATEKQNTAQLAAFLRSLFTEIPRTHPATATTVLDFFHGHLIANESQRDVCVVFHAKEWPSEETTYRLPAWKQHGFASTSTPTFRLADAAMNERNFVWSLRAGGVWLLRDPLRTNAAKRDAGYAELLVDPAPGKVVTSLDATQWQAGTVPELNFGVDLAGLNYFPTVLAGAEATEVIVAPNGQWGVLFHLEQTYPTVPRATIETVYKDTDYSLVQSRDALDVIIGKK